MRWVTYQSSTGVARAGAVVDDVVHGLDATLVEILDELDDAGAHATTSPVERVPYAEARLLSPIPHPPSIRDFYAFEQHVKTARERRGLDMDPDWYELPVFYFTNPHVVRATGDDVAIPSGCVWMDYELEVAAVLGQGGGNLTPDEGEAAIAGFVVMNDWSARDIQAREMKQGLGPAKGKDFATSLGPFLVTPDEIAGRKRGKAHDLTMTARVNGVEYSRGNLSDVFWSFGEMIAYASRDSRVGPGDVIGSGTVGTGCILELSLVHGGDAYPWLKPGDVVDLEVDGLGILTNTIVGP